MFHLFAEYGRLITYFRIFGFTSKNLLITKHQVGNRCNVVLCDVLVS